MPRDPSHPPTLRVLQQLQEAFDCDRGLNFEQASSSELRMFSGLALAGEVGELANALKKAQRADWLGDDPELHIQRAIAETGDVLAYLLKLATSLGVDLTEVYLNTMSDNCLRFRPRAARVGGVLLTIAGPTGSGKTTIARALSTDHPTLLEDVSNNPHLEALLTNNPKFNAYENQRWFLSRVEEFVGAADSNTTTVLDQEPLAIVRAYARMFRDTKQLSNDDYNSLLIDLLQLESRLARWTGGRTVIFLDAPAKVLRERAALRGDPAVPTDEWFENVRRYFADLRSHVPSPTVIATNDLSIPETVRVVHEALQRSQTKATPADLEI
jgi:deoxyadenosine/deoxycytidine kinase/NTP pyrophosphatase (non-canonical NTP hydrolase)